MESECSFWNRRDFLKVGGTYAAALGMAGAEAASAQAAQTERDRIGHKLGWQVLEDGVSPTLVGGYATPVLVPDSFEGAFGYSGNLRFVKFGYRRVEVGRN